MPHLSARRIASLAGFESFVQRAAAEAGVERCFVIAGDLPTPMGPFADSAALIDTGVFERAGMQVIGVGGHPEGHPVMSKAEQWEVLERKCRSIEKRSMAPLIVTQFAFDADVVLTWLQALRARGITHPVRVGVPGPASIAVLARYAAVCGVGACASMWSKYGVSIGKLFLHRGAGSVCRSPGRRTDSSACRGQPDFFPFGGIAQSVKWIEQYRAGADPGP